MIRTVKEFNSSSDKLLPLGHHDSTITLYNNDNEVFKIRKYKGDIPDLL